MKRKVLAISLPVMLLSNVGCSADWIFAKDNEKEIHAIEKETKKEEQSYSNNISRLSSQLEIDVTELQKYFFDSSETGKEDLNTRLALFKTTISKIKKLEVPKNYKEAHKEVLKAVDLYESSINYRLESIEKKDQKGIDESKEKTKEAGDKLEEARKKVNSVDLQKSKEMWGK
ncbi:hypothetical protein P4493_05560 [Bacillus thuringiensis]|uniref:Lipoprotein n=4 Tax=Bacillus thuringiensis TaxID=1428 RepID=A0A0B5NBM7_BACTU|nr:MULTISPECIES: hypothetical protein [Bacillus]EAO56469.1 hypothetical protein RBTH_07440 [Bacillus thuringiensis serovar israelensis ATCC 35646]MEC2534087.1 hypothetical protein [Bacillus cereus]MED1153536.1 hypothetical protein [Bacillus paranthracis]OUB09171.1 hypothetical protein BK708_32045 [Bacillus thuringiensis serovar yunnanensis]AFQ29864.1 hypothetical protein BTF1_28817 [Bacillus thuringiensis HD-789]